MDLSLLAGATSRGLNDALQGANTGLLQGEQIRAQRAQQDLAQQHFGLQQQQLTSHLAQQAYANALARANQDIQRQHLGLQQQQLQNQMGYHAGQLGLQSRHLDLQEQELPWKIGVEKERADWMRERYRGGPSGSTMFKKLDTIAQSPKYGLRSYLEGTPEQQAAIEADMGRITFNTDPFAQQKSDRYGQWSTHYNDMHNAAVAKLGQLQNNPKISPQDQIRLKQVNYDMRTLYQAASQLQQAQLNGQPAIYRDPFTNKVFTPETVAAGMASNDKILTTMGQSYAPQGGGAAPPPAAAPQGPMSIQDLRSQFKYR